jgi:two-component system, chemotaxis family, chemotaxis protein CheY
MWILGGQKGSWGHFGRLWLAHRKQGSKLTAYSSDGAYLFRASGASLGEYVMAIDLSMPVLVVDDYNTMVRIIRNLLRQLGFENVDDANDGTTALEKMRARRYGLIISDWNMEPMTGYDLLKEMRSDPHLLRTPFIMVTAESKTDNVIAAKKAGVSNYIVKPFNAQTLKSKIETVFMHTSVSD